ncbi:MAG: hypothetical protein HRT64_14560, partial [Erythrobacter sp.]|nr:hypothetical protein [Erythrobacter sp.]
PPIVAEPLYSTVAVTLWGSGIWANEIAGLAGVSVPNVGSERLHDSMGFSTIGDIAPAGHKFGTWVPVRLYQLLLGACDDSIEAQPIRSVESVCEMLGLES